MDIVSSVSRHCGAKAEAASRVVVFDAVVWLALRRLRAAATMFAKHPLTGDAATLSRCRQITA
jgi:hypothetical protein